MIIVNIQKDLHIQMKYKNIILVFTLIALLIGCSKNEDKDVFPEPSEELTTYQRKLIQYFKEIALGMEYDNKVKIVKKWEMPMKLFIDGKKTKEVLDKLDETIFQINELVGKDNKFHIELVDDINQANGYMFLGSKEDFLSLHPDMKGYIKDNWALFYVWWNNNVLYKTKIYIKADNTTIAEQKSLILEELTQSIGLFRDSPRYKNSIFYETPNDGGFAQVYSRMDKDLIRLLYHPKIKVGYNDVQVEKALKEILINEN